MTFTEWAVLFLCAERGFAMSVGFYRGASAALRATKRPEARTSATEWPDFVEVASHDVMSLDYSAKHKRH
jgi:hypothetical protein